MLWALKIRGALILSIVAHHRRRLRHRRRSTLPDEFTITPNFSTLGLGLQDLGGIFTIPTGVLGALLAIFTIMLSDFFDTMGTVTGVAAEAGLAEEDGTVPGVGRVLLVDGLAAAVGGAAGVSSNTTYIESAAGVADGGRTGLTSVVVGILFLAAILLSPLAAIIPTQATAPALVLVGFLMFTQIGEIDARDFLIGFPALLIIILMPLTFTITIGIGAGMVMWVVLQVVAGRAAQVHWLMWLVFLAFLLFFAQTWVNRHARGLTACDMTDGARPGQPAGRYAFRHPCRHDPDGARLRVDDFDYRLPAAAIAQVPAEPRDAARLLVLDRGALPARPAAPDALDLRASSARRCGRATCWSPTTRA